MNAKTVGLIHPGNMGVTVGAAAAAGGASVIWASEGRSKTTHDRAKKAGLTDIGNLTELVRASDVILAVCPPHAAPEVARTVMMANFNGIYVDANAVAPATAIQISELVTKGGTSFRRWRYYRSARETERYHTSLSLGSHGRGGGRYFRRQLA